MDPRSSDETSRRDIPSFIEPRPPLIHHPFMRPRPEKGINLLEKFEEDSHIEEPELVQVYLRMKPCKVPNNLYELRSDKCLVTSLDTTTAGHGRRTQHNVSKMYTFSRIFNAESSQKEVFDQVVKDNLKRLIDGYSFTLLTYGASGSGKTYTVMGTVNSPGLVPRALEFLFKLVDAAQIPHLKPSDNGTDELSFAQQDTELQWVKRLLQISAPFRDKYKRMSVQLHSDLTVSSVDLTNRTKHYVWVSFVEIYNEAIYDLLAPPEKRAKLRLREDSAGNVYVKGVTQAFVRSGEEAYNVMVAGKHNLVVAATGIHAQSSRSHCIFTITMLTEKDGEIRTSHVRLCDLAGCERQSAARNTGVRMLESRKINSSLHVLERCLHMLRRKQLTKESAMIPYRECKLTRLLGAGLSGARGEAVSMVVTVNPAPQHAHETRHVLALAVVARDIQINNTVDPTVTTLSSLECTQDSTVQDYTDEIMRLRTENERLHFELVQAQSCISQLHRSMEQKQQENANTMMELVEDTKDMMREFYEQQLARLRSQMNEMEEDYETKLAEMAKKLNMNETVDREEKLPHETRHLKEIEVQYLRECNKESNANEYEKRESLNLDPAYGTDSDNEFESDTDLLDESLEPVKQIRKSILNKEASKKKEAFIDLINESSEEESYNEESDNDTIDDPSINDRNVTKDLPTRNSDLIPKDSLYETGDDDSELRNESGQIENATDSASNLALLISKVNYKDETIEVETDKNETDNNNAERDKSECEELFNVSTKLNETQENLEKDVIPASLRGTYFVNETQGNLEKDVVPTRGTYFVRNEPQKECNIEQKLKTLNTVRGTYFIAEREMSFYNETNVESDNERDRESALKNKVPPVKDKESPVISNVPLVKNKESPVKNRESLVISNVPLVKNKESPVKNKESPVKDKESTLKTREFLLKDNEFSVKNNESPTEFIETKKGVNTLVSKLIKTFKIRQNSASSLQQFEQLELAVNNADNSANGVKGVEITIPTQILKGKRYFDDTAKEAEMNTEKTNACENSGELTKTQEKRLLFDSPDKQDKSNILETENTIQSLIFTPKVVKEAQLFYNENDKVSQNDVLLSKSPSIVKDDTTTEYEPSVATKKILGESFTKPEILSSIRTERLASKKHESVDIFESPLSSITKASSKEINNIDITANKNALRSEPKHINTEIVSVSNLKERAAEIAHEFIEDLVSTQKIKAYIKREELEAKNTVTQESAENIKNHDNTKETTKEIKEETLLFTTFNTEQTSKGNNTTEEFENIIKDLTNVRATEFELLIAEDLTAPPNEATQELDRMDKIDGKEEMTERTKKFEETKYNLRHKGKSYLNVSDDKKDKETEQILEGSKAKGTTKRCLRLRRRKNNEELGSDRDNENRLRDIVNLKEEFCDVTMGVPAVRKEVTDMQSPEKNPEEEENVPPMLGIQSCPSKSVTRSRRKLFTPRAEPLEESPSQAGDSNERVYVPRPSYHRARARRKL